MRSNTSAYELFLLLFVSLHAPCSKDNKDTNLFYMQPHSYAFQFLIACKNRGGRSGGCQCVHRKTRWVCVCVGGGAASVKREAHEGSDFKHAPDLTVRP